MIPQRTVPKQTIPRSTFQTIVSPYAVRHVLALPADPEKSYHQDCIINAKYTWTPKDVIPPLKIYNTTLAYWSTVLWGFIGGKGGERAEIADNYSMGSCKTLKKKKTGYFVLPFGSLHAIPTKARKEKKRKSTV